MPNIKIKDAATVTPKYNYKIPVGNTEYDDARTITIQDLKQWMGDAENGGGGWSYTDLTNVPALVGVNDVKTINGESILGVGNLDVEASTIQWENVVNKPTIPTKTSELENDSNFTPYETIAADFQEKLISGTNIATVNGYNLLSGGNIVISGGGGGSVTWDDVTGKPDFADVAFTGDYDDLTNKPDKREKRVEITQSGSVTISLNPNTLYVFNGGAIDEFTFSLVAPDDAINYVNTYHFIFLTGTNAVINWDASVIGFVGGNPPTLEDNTVYEVSIIEGYATIIHF